ncbi:hypothetical protein BC829DRAFT_196742 [Chytridium lagenaria]|nr:hypothetical protein BC829DRAFT_196742 [Chytridium lagenaria]
MGFFTKHRPHIRAFTDFPHPHTACRIPNPFSVFCETSQPHRCFRFQYNVLPTDDRQVVHFARVVKNPATAEASPSMTSTVPGQTILADASTDGQNDPSTNNVQPIRAIFQLYALPLTSLITRYTPPPPPPRRMLDLRRGIP